MKHPSIEKREAFVIKQLYKISEIKTLSEFDNDLALELALDMQKEMLANIEPYLFWQTAVNKLVNELNK